MLCLDVKSEKINNYRIRLNFSVDILTDNCLQILVSKKEKKTFFIICVRFGNDEVKYIEQEQQPNKKKIYETTKKKKIIGNLRKIKKKTSIILIGSQPLQILFIFFYYFV